MRVIVQHRVLHVICDAPLPADLIALATVYEGDVPGRVGLNFPMSIAATSPFFRPYCAEADYVIVYRKGDILTKRHELQHAKYAMDADYRRAVQAEWASWSDTYRTHVIEVLVQQLKYPADTPLDRLMDEYQAYQTTERVSPFGERR
jgi:hypothetical protein